MKFQFVLFAFLISNFISAQNDESDVEFPDTIYFSNLELISDTSQLNLPDDAEIIDTIEYDHLLVYKTKDGFFIAKSFKHHHMIYLICALEYDNDECEVYLYGNEKSDRKNLLRVSVTSGFWHMSYCDGGGYSVTSSYFIDIKSMQLICEVTQRYTESSCSNDACRRSDEDTSHMEDAYRCEDEIYIDNKIKIRRERILIIPGELAKSDDEYLSIHDLREISKPVVYEFRKSYLLKIK